MNEDERNSWKFWTSFKNHRYRKNPKFVINISKCNEEELKFSKYSK